MSDLKNWFNLQQPIRTASLTLLASQLLRSYSFGFTLEDSSEKEHPSPRNPRHLEEPHSTLYTASINATETHRPSAALNDWLRAGNGRRVKLVLYSQPPQNDPPRLWLQTRGTDHFAGPRPKSVNGNTTNQSKKKTALSASWVTKSRAANRKRMQISQYIIGYLLSTIANNQMLGSHPFSFKHN